MLEGALIRQIEAERDLALDTIFVSASLSGIEK
jgi:hypothetical protein